MRNGSATAGNSAGAMSRAAPWLVERARADDHRADADVLLDRAARADADDRADAGLHQLVDDDAHRRRAHAARGAHDRARRRAAGRRRRRGRGGATAPGIPARCSVAMSSERAGSPLSRAIVVPSSRSALRTRGGSAALTGRHAREVVTPVRPVESGRHQRRRSQSCGGGPGSRATRRPTRPASAGPLSATWRHDRHAAELAVPLGHRRVDGGPLRGAGRPTLWRRSGSLAVSTTVTVDRVARFDVEPVSGRVRRRPDHHEAHLPVEVRPGRAGGAACSR